MEESSESDSRSSIGSEDGWFYTAPPSEISTSDQPTKVLMIHGDAMSGISFSHKTRFFHPLLARACPSGYTISYPTAPGPRFPPDPTALHIPYKPGEIHPSHDLDAWAWAYGDYTKERTLGWEDSMRKMIAYIKLHGPFDGIVGFSAGAGMALFLASLMERRHLPASPIKDALGIDEGDLQKPFKWAILFSGFKMYNDYYKPLYEPRVKTPCLHFIGRVDPVVPHQHTMDLMAVCENSELVWHDGAHILCKSQEAKEKIVEWIERCNRDGWGKIQEEDLVWEEVVTNLKPKRKGKRITSSHSINC